MLTGERRGRRVRIPQATQSQGRSDDRNFISVVTSAVFSENEYPTWREIVGSGLLLREMLVVLLRLQCPPEHPLKFYHGKGHKRGKEI